MAVLLGNKLIFVAVSVVGLWASLGWSRSFFEASMEERHEMWMAQYDRAYADNTEKEKRFKVFKENVELIESFNKAGNKPYKLGISEFTDLTNEEFRASRNGYKRPSPHRSSSKSFRYENVTEVASSLDWRTKGAVTPIKDQGQCGESHELLSLQIVC